MEDGRNGAVIAGRVLQFPGWDELRNMPAEDLKAWLLSKQHEHAQYVAVASTMGGNLSSRAGLRLSGAQVESAPGGEARRQ